MSLSESTSVLFRFVFYPASKSRLWTNETDEFIHAWSRVALPGILFAATCNYIPDTLNFVPVVLVIALTGYLCETVIDLPMPT